MKTSHRQQRRKGITVAVMAIMLIVVVGMVAMSVEVGRLLSLRNEMQNAVDAGAVAATLYLAQDTDGFDEAADRARAFVQINRVGSAVTIPTEAITVDIGQWDPLNEVFTTTQVEPNAVRVFANSESESFFFGRVFGKQLFGAPGDAIATGSALPLDIMMVLDLSGSMEDEGRIQALWNSSPIFVNVIQSLEGDDQIGMMGLAADPGDYDPVAEGHSGVEYESGLHPTDDHYVGVLEAILSDDFDNMRNNVLTEANMPASKYTGWTGTGASLGDAVHYLVNGSEARSFTRKAIVLMSDGHANRPSDNGPGYAMTMAAYAQSNKVRVYTISLGNGADVDLMEAIADATGAEHFDATGSGEAQLTDRLTEAFKRAAAAMKRSQLVK